MRRVVGRGGSIGELNGRRRSLRRAAFPTLTVLAIVGCRSLEDAEPRARRLHDESIIILAHDHQFTRDDFKDMKTGGVTAKVLKLTTDSIDWDLDKRVRFNIPEDGSWRERFLGYLNQVQTLAQEKDSDILIVRGVEDLFLAKRQGKVGAILGSEGAWQLENRIESVEEFYDLGWRETQLRWAAPSQLFLEQHLSDYGKQVVSECNRLGILIDVSHLSLGAMRDILANSTDPVVRSHDSPRSIGGESDDAMILAVAQSGGGHGVFAIHFYEGYIRPPTVERVVDAIDYVVRLAGIDHVALGGDYFPEDGREWAIPDVTHLRDLTLALVRRGYDDDEIRKILGLNLIRLYERVWEN